MFLIPLCCLAAALVLRVCYPQLKKKDALRGDFILAGVELIVLLAVFLLLRRFAFGSDGSIPLLATGICCALPYAYNLLGCWKKTEKLAPFLKRISVFAAVLLLTEVFFMNLKSFTTEQKSAVFSPEDISLAGEAEIDGNVIEITGGAQLNLKDVPDGMEALLLYMSQKKSKDMLPFKVSLGMRDDNFTESNQLVQQKYEMAAGTVCSLSFHPYGKIHVLQISFDEIKEPVTVRYIRAVSALPFAFSSLRFWILLVIGGLVIAVITYKWYLVRYHSRKPVHNILVVCTVAICVALCGCVQRSWDKPYDYDADHVHTEDPYAMTMDAFLKGQLWLDLEVDPLLEEVENVYSRDEREESDAFAYWDLAYYEGHYYAYFGVTPVFLFYYPHYLLTEKQPTVNMTMLFYGVLAVIFLSLAVLELLHLLSPHPNLVLLLLSFPVLCSICGIYWLLNIGGTYGLPPICGMCFLFLCIWTGLLACRSRNMVKRMILLFISGAAMTFSVGARPSIALNAAVLIPLFIGILLYRRQKIQIRLGQAAVFLVPVILGAAGLMYYNKARFGSAVEFGTSYQLTVSNVQANKLLLTDFPGALFNYFVIPPRLRPAFPYFDTQWGTLYNYRHYVYTEGVIGWLCYAIIPFGILLMPKAVEAGVSVRRCRTNKLQRNIMLLICFVMPVLLTWMDFSMAGSCQRYFYDVIPLLIMGCVICMMRCCKRSRYLYFLSCVALVSSFVLSWLVLISNRDCGLVRNLPDLYNTVEDLVIFWQ